MEAGYGRAALFLVLASASTISCGQALPGSQKSTNQPAAATVTAEHPTERTVMLFETGEVLVITSSADGPRTGSLTALSDGDSSDRAARILRVLKSARADEAFIRAIGPRLEQNRRLKQNEFTLPLTDESGRSYRFDYVADTANQLYTLNFKLPRSNQ